MPSRRTLHAIDMLAAFGAILLVAGMVALLAGKFNWAGGGLSLGGLALLIWLGRAASRWSRRLDERVGPSSKVTREVRRFLVAIAMVTVFGVATFLWLGVACSVGLHRFQPR